MGQKTPNRYFRSVMDQKLLVGACVLCTQDQKPSHNGLDMMTLKGFKALKTGAYVPGFRIHCSKAATKFFGDEGSEIFSFTVPVNEFDSAELAVNVAMPDGIEAEFGRAHEDQPFTPKNKSEHIQFLKIRIVPGQKFSPLFVQIEKLNIDELKTEPHYFCFRASVKDGTVSVGLKKVTDNEDLPHFWQE